MSAPNAVIFFNSRTAGPHRHLSNFYGGVEFAYQAWKFDATTADGAAVHTWLRDLASVDGGAPFESMLKRLQPEKSTWSDAQLKYWYDGDEPIRGILAKLVGNSVKGTEGMNKRLALVVQLATGNQLTAREVEAWRAACVHSFVSEMEVEEQMRTCLRAKFGPPGQFRELLLSTGERALHEKPMRGKGDRWTLHVDKTTGERTGGDMLGRLLVSLRAELRAEEAERLGAAEVSGVDDGAGERPAKVAKIAPSDNKGDNTGDGTVEPILAQLPTGKAKPRVG
mmetsp:Transcript_25841/g.82920  ORF Transcript_25841/g.82920 Transcript_25841/m.82920 type:complete len:281 (+) Transcript_25841:74-916(+)